MALTISQAGNGVVTSSAASVATGNTITAAAGDWLVAFVAASNDGNVGASAIGTLSDSSSNPGWTNRATINYDPGAAGAGATLRVATCAVTVALSSGSVSCSMSPNITEGAIQVYKVVPGAAQVVTFRACDTTGSTGNATSYTAAQVSVTSGDTIFGAAAIETDDAITGDTDTTNGSWSTIWTVLADAGADASTMSVASQYKTATGTGNQNWACSSTTGRDSARTYLVIYPAADTVDDLLANDVQSTSEVSAPAVHQKHGLLANDVQSTSEVSAPALHQVHALLANDVEMASQVSAPAVHVVNILAANDVEMASQVSAPAIGQKHVLLADDVQSLSQVSAPAIHQTHGLLANDVQSTAEVSAPAVQQKHALLANDVQSLSQVSTPTIRQIHALLANDVQSLSQLSVPALAESNGSTDVLLANDVEMATVVSLAQFRQTHVLTANDISSAMDVSTPTLALLVPPAPPMPVPAWITTVLKVAYLD